MYITKIYEQLKEVQGDMSRNKFCTEYLGTDRNYMNVCLNQNKDLSEAAMVRLYKKLKYRAEQWRLMSDEKQGVNDIYTKRYKEFDVLRCEVMNQLLEC